MVRNNGERMLLVIHALNVHGAASVLDVHRETKISRSSIYRLLEILCRLGYAKRQPDRAVYQLTPAILQLSDQVGHKDWINEFAVPVIRRLHERVIWPTSLATFDKGSMVVRATTKSYSPLMFDHGRIGSRLPVLETAHGLVYLAHCSSRMQRAAFDFLKASGDLRENGARPPAGLKSLLTEAKKRGYAVRRGGIEKGTNTVAVPIVVEDTAIGSLCVTFLNSAVSIDQGIKKFVEPLRAASSKISTSIAQLAYETP
jgi:IclR family mhp operon transcriptional activator